MVRSRPDTCESGDMEVSCGSCGSCGLGGWSWKWWAVEMPQWSPCFGSETIGHWGDSIHSIWYWLVLVVLGVWRHLYLLVDNFPIFPLLFFWAGLGGLTEHQEWKPMVTFGSRSILENQRMNGSYSQPTTGIGDLRFLSHTHVLSCSLRRSSQETKEGHSARLPQEMASGALMRLEKHSRSRVSRYCM
jgi:hypothetical protein